VPKKKGKTSAKMKLILLTCLSLSLTLTQAAFGEAEADSLPDLIIQYTNRERVAVGLSPLAANARLNGAAQHHARNMATRDTLSHTLADADLPGLSDRIRYYGYPAWGYGENIAYGPVTAREVVANWMSSPGHRANILSADYKDIGVGLAYTTVKGETRPYYCQDFGRPSE
jgi:uncharacterized protein YkwD